MQRQGGSHCQGLISRYAAKSKCTAKRMSVAKLSLQSYGTDNYTAYGCYDFTPPSSINQTQTLTEFGVYQSVSSSTPTNVNISANSTSISFPFSTSPLGVEAGALLSFSTGDAAEREVLVRFGVSFINTDQACANAEEEIPDWDWDAVQSASEGKWQDVLERIGIDTEKENATVVELLYSSVRFYSCFYFSIYGFIDVDKS